MDFAYDTDQDLLRQSSRALIERMCPISAIRAAAEDGVPISPEVWSAAADLGWFSTLVPEDLGGMSLSAQPIVDLCAISEEFGRGLLSGPLIDTNIVASALAADLGTPRAESVRGLMSGEAVAAWAVAEPRGWASYDPTFAVSVDGGFRLTGVKELVQDADVADYVLVSAQDAAGWKQFLFDELPPAVTIRTVESLDITRRFFDLEFDDVFVPSSAVVDAGCPERDVERQFDLATVLQAAESVGGAERVLEFTVDYANSREQFGRPIGSFQAVKHQLAEMYMTIEAASAATHYGALTLAGTDDPREAVAVARTVSGEAFSKVTMQSLQIHGAIGFTWEHDLHLYLRRAKVNEVRYGGLAANRERLVQSLVGS